MIEQNYNNTISHNSMQVNKQSQFPCKISIAKITQMPMVDFNSRAVPSLPNHISWEEDRPLSSKQNTITSQSKAPTATKKRRKIFEHHEQKSQEKVKVRCQVSQQKRIDEGFTLRKIKSNASIKPDISQEADIEEKLREVNRQLAEHRSSRTQLSLASSDRKKHDTSQAWSKVQQKLRESTDLIRRQEEVLSSKMPSFERKIDANNSAISEVSSLIQTKFEQSNKNVSKMLEIVNKNESRLKIKQQQLDKINSELLQKELELMKNKEQNKKRQLELIRMKRIEDLQNRNLELYQSIERNSFRHFENLEDNEGLERDVWQDDEEHKLSKLSAYPQSTIKYQDQSMNRSANNTIGQILSPLAFSQYQY